jgi:hypothetical protein
LPVCQRRRRQSAWLASQRHRKVAHDSCSVRQSAAGVPPGAAATRGSAAASASSIAPARPQSRRGVGSERRGAGSESGAQAGTENLLLFFAHSLRCGRSGARIRNMRRRWSPLTPHAPARWANNVLCDVRRRNAVGAGASSCAVLAGWRHRQTGGTSDSHPTFRRHKRRAPGPTSPRGAL